MSLRWLNSALAARTLSEILKDDLLGTATFQDVGARERAGDAPGLIVNTTLYNNGRRLVMSTLPHEAFDYNFVAELERSVTRSGRPMRNADTIARRWDTLKPLTPADIRMDPCPIVLVGAAAASASFPPLVGPITMRVGDEEVFWHVGDGGLYENSGLETLLFLHLKQLRDKGARKSLIIAFDSSYPFAVGERQLSRRSLPFTLLTFDFSRVPSIMEERASAYQQLFFQSLQLEGVFPGPEAVMVVLLRHTDAKWNEDLSDLPKACEGERAQLPNIEAVRERIAEIPTLLRLPSACDRALLERRRASWSPNTRQAWSSFWPVARPGSKRQQRRRAVPAATRRVRPPAGAPPVPRCSRPSCVPARRCRSARSRCDRAACRWAGCAPIPDPAPAPPCDRESAWACGAT